MTVLALKYSCLVQTPCAKTAKSYAFCDCTPVDGLDCFFRLWNRHFDCRIQRKLNSGLWLGAFGKVWLFRCQSGIRRLWLTAFGRSGFFRCQSTFATRFCLRHCVFLCKGTKAQKATLFALFGEAEFWDCTPVLAFETGNFFRGFG